MQKVWNDNRSGRTGCIAGNIVLRHLCSGETVVHEKGTVFSTPTRVLVGRFCSVTYLQKGIAHFCNVSKTQVDDLASLRKKVYYLFITVEPRVINYWVVPGTIVSGVLDELRVKPNSQTCFVRITEENSRFYLGNRDISRFHHRLALSRNISQAKVVA